MKLRTTPNRHAYLSDVQSEACAVESLPEGLQILFNNRGALGACCEMIGMALENAEWMNRDRDRQDLPEYRQDLPEA